MLAFVKKDLVYGFFVKPKMKHTHILLALLDTYKIFFELFITGNEIKLSIGRQSDIQTSRLL